jgi:hypothetical protein
MTLTENKALNYAKKDFTKNKNSKPTVKGGQVVMKGMTMMMMMRTFSISGEQIAQLV